jgi:4-diphosphocytidyl-2-C-methyl-D-erythritol kinase
MLFFPNCKINLGLYVTEKRSDGFHNIETVFYPINWCDALEVIESEGAERALTFSFSGLPVIGKVEDNIIYKAWELIVKKHVLPSIKVHLHKNIPMGAGLGGGSADAAFFIQLLDRKFQLGMHMQEKMELASSLGSDCAFFLENKAVLAKGKGNDFSDIKVDLSKYYILVVHPGIHSDTRRAYSQINPGKPSIELLRIIENEPISNWSKLLVNDFEQPVIEAHPRIGELKQNLYDMGAIYVSMSGSGSAVFGIYEQLPRINFASNYSYHLQVPG